MASILQIGERHLTVMEQVLRLSLRGRPPLALWRADFELRARDDDWEALLQSASPLPVPVAPFAGGEAVELDVPLRDLAGTSFNVTLCVFEHAPVRETRLRLAPLGSGAVRLRLTGRSDVWFAPHERNLDVELEIDLLVSEIRVDSATDEHDAAALVEGGGFALPEGCPVGQKYGSWRIFLPQPSKGAKQS